MLDEIGQSKAQLITRIAELEDYIRESNDLILAAKKAQGKEYHAVIFGLTIGAILGFFCGVGLSMDLCR